MLSTQLGMGLSDISLHAPLGPYLGGSTAGQMSQVSDSGRSPGIAGADQDRSANFHGVPVACGLGGLVCHTESGEGVALLGILLAVHTPLKGTDRPRAA